MNPINNWSAKLKLKLKISPHPSLPSPPPSQLLKVEQNFSFFIPLFFSSFLSVGFTLTYNTVHGERIYECKFRTDPSILVISSSVSMCISLGLLLEPMSDPYYCPCSPLLLYRCGSGTCFKTPLGGMCKNANPTEFLLEICINAHFYYQYFFLFSFYYIYLSFFLPQTKLFLTYSLIILAV